MGRAFGEVIRKKQFSFVCDIINLYFHVEVKHKMTHTNTIRHYLSEDGIRLTVADTSSLSAEAESIHQLPPAAAMVLAKAMTGAAILINDFKNHEGITLKWMTGSPIGQIHVDAYDGRFIRGFLDHPEGAEGLPCDTLYEATLVSTAGQLFVTRYSLLKSPYTSTVNLQHEDISACLTEYLNTSEQTLSAVKLDLKMTPQGEILRSSGFLAQLMPKGNMAVFAELFRDLDKWDLTREADEEGSLEKLLVEGNFQILQEAPLSFRCTCSEDRIRSTLLTLPEAEKAELTQDESIEIVCPYCDKKYTISQQQLKKWFDEAKGAKVQ